MKILNFFLDLIRNIYQLIFSNVEKISEDPDFLGIL